MSWKLSRSICFLCKPSGHCTGNLLLCQVPEKFLLFQVTDQTKEGAERKGVLAADGLRGATTQKPAGERREPGHGHCCSPTCEEKTYRVSGRRQKPEMSCFWRTSDLAVLLIWGVFVAESRCMNGTQTAQNSSSTLPEVNITGSVQIGTKARLCCPDIPLTKAVLITWEIILRDQLSCRISYRVETKETNETNCTDRRITWASTPDQNPDLQISAVALDHDGHYLCIIATPNGNFQKRHDLQVLVPPEVTLSPWKNRTAVCEATAGKPAAQISWTPDGDCKTMNESHSNGTVTVRSTCHWEQSNVSAMFCFVSHLTGNQTRSIELNQSGKASQSYILYVIPCTTIIIVLIIIGCIWLLKSSDFRKCKWTRPGASTVVEEDDMQPYASYTEKSNPLYDTVTKVEEACSMPQGEVNGTDWLALSATGI